MPQTVRKRRVAGVKRAPTGTPSLLPETPDQAGAQDLAIHKAEVEDLIEGRRFLRREIHSVFVAFYVLNGAVGAFVLILWLVQSYFLYQRTPTVVLVTERVVLALIAASAAQLGALAVTVGSLLLKQQSPPSS